MKLHSNMNDRNREGSNRFRRGTLLLLSGLTITGIGSMPEDVSSPVQIPGYAITAFAETQLVEADTTTQAATISTEQTTQAAAISTEMTTQAAAVSTESTAQQPAGQSIQQTENSANQSDTAVQEEVPVLCETMTLYKGEQDNIEIANVGGISSVSFSSSNPKIASVSKDGRIKALSCGETVITVEMKKQKKDANGEIKDVLCGKAEITLKVEISNLYKTESNAKKVKKNADNSKQPVLRFSKTLVKGKKSSISLQGITKDAEVTYQSQSPAVAKVSTSGVITACKTGDTVITISVTQNGCQYKYQEKIQVIAQKEKASITGTQRDAYFSKSGFVGNSISVGQRIYFDYKGKNFLGHPVMMVRESYSFYNDMSASSKIKVSYKGKLCRAKDAIAKYKVKRVFINMGMNDLGISAEATYKNYVNYLKGIREKNPDVVIFIQSMTPLYKARGSLNNTNVNKLNKLLSSYCDTQKDMYYIDVNSALKGSDGRLKREYCSDSFCHLTIKAYEVWTNQLCDYVDRLLIAEQEAKDAVATAAESGLASDYKKAQKKVAKLEKSTVKDKLRKRLKKAK